MTRMLCLKDKAIIHKIVIDQHDDNHKTKGAGVSDKVVAKGQVQAMCYPVNEAIEAV